MCANSTPTLQWLTRSFVLIAVGLYGCHSQVDPTELRDGLQPMPLPIGASGMAGLAGLPHAPSPECPAVQAGEVVLNEYLVRPGGMDLDGDGKSNGRDELIELTLHTQGKTAHLGGVKFYVDGALRGTVTATACLDPSHLFVLVGSTTGLGTWQEGTDEVRLDHLLRLPDGGGSLEMRTADDALLFRHSYAAESSAAPSSWTRTIDGDGAADWQRHLDWGDGHGRPHTLGLCNDGQPACACLASQGMDCGGLSAPRADGT